MKVFYRQKKAAHQSGLYAKEKFFYLAITKFLETAWLSKLTIKK